MVCATAAAYTRFLEGRHATLGHEPPRYLSSMTAVRTPRVEARVQHSYLPASPEPMDMVS